MKPDSSGRVLWRSWIAENLARGVEPARLLPLLCEAGLAPDVARAEVEAAASHPAVRQVSSETHSRRDWESLLAAGSALFRQEASRPAAGLQVERRHRLAPEEFFERYYLRNRPVIIEGLLEDWPALSRWSPEWLAERFGDEPVEVMAGREADADPDFNAERMRHSMPLREFVARMREGRTNDVYLVARNSLLKRDAFRPLVEDLRAPAGYIRPDLRVDDSVHVWFGPAGTLSNLHHDHLNVLFCQVFGRKRFWLAPSWELPWLYNDRGLYSAVDILAPDLGRFPDFQRAALHTCEVGPGDTLLIPVGWWHAVQALEVSLSVTFVCFDLPAENTQWRDYWIGPRPEGTR